MIKHTGPCNKTLDLATTKIGEGCCRPRKDPRLELQRFNTAIVIGNSLLKLQSHGFFFHLRKANLWFLTVYRNQARGKRKLYSVTRGRDLEVLLSNIIKTLELK
jgi:hypothetical protein